MNSFCLSFFPICFTLLHREGAGCVCPQTGQVPPLPHPPLNCVHPCHTKVLIRCALTRFIVCLIAGKQAHYSFA